MIHNRRLLLFSACLLVMADAAQSHHSFKPVFDSDRMETIEGEVREFHLVNPHSSMVVDVIDSAGDLVTWAVEFDSRHDLTGGGWDIDTIPVGARVTVTGYATHNGSPALFFHKLRFADGRELLRPYQERLDRLNEERRRRGLGTQN